MGIAKASGLGMLLEPGDVMDCCARRGAAEGEESADDRFDIFGDAKTGSGFLKNG